MRHCERRVVSAALTSLRRVVDAGRADDTTDDVDARSALRCAAVRSGCALASRALVDAAEQLELALRLAFDRTDVDAALRRAAVRGAKSIVPLVAATTSDRGADGVVRRLVATTRAGRAAGLVLLRAAAAQCALWRVDTLAIVHRKPALSRSFYRH